MLWHKWGSQPPPSRMEVSQLTRGSPLAAPCDRKSQQSDFWHKWGSQLTWGYHLASHVTERASEEMYVQGGHALGRGIGLCGQPEEPDNSSCGSISMGPDPILEKWSACCFLSIWGSFLGVNAFKGNAQLRGCPHTNGRGDHLVAIIFVESGNLPSYGFLYPSCQAGSGYSGKSVSARIWWTHAVLSLLTAITNKSCGHFIPHLFQKHCVWWCYLCVVVKGTLPLLPSPIL